MLDEPSNRDGLRRLSRQAAKERSVRTRALYLIVAIVAFAPVAMLVLMGALILPFWFRMVCLFLADLPSVAGGKHPAVVMAFPSLLVIGGMIGLAGISQVIVAAMRPETCVRLRRLVQGAVGIGVVSLLGFSWNYPAMVDPVGHLRGLFAYLILPAAGAAFFLFQSRENVFGAHED